MSLSKISFGCSQISEQFSLKNQITHMVAFEKAYTKALSQSGLIDGEIFEAAAQQISQAQLDEQALVTALQRDGVIVPELIAQLKGQTDEALHHALHKGATSQDVMDSAMSLTLQKVNVHFEDALKKLIAVLGNLDERFGAHKMMSRTRMQAALPIKVGHRINAWRSPLEEHLNSFAIIRAKMEVLQFGGAVGDRRSLKNKGADVAQHLAENLGLNNPSQQWQTTRGNVVNYGNWVALVSGSLGKLGQDIALMAQQGIDEITLSGGGQSSAMPHKQNPILAEKLITLARYNATQTSGLHNAMIHEQERSGAAWGLEWMILPQICESLGAALNAANDLCLQIKQIGTPNKA